MAFRSNQGGHIAGEDISAYVDEELSPAETSRVYAHLQSCDECTALAADMRATQTLMRSMPLVRAPREFTLGPEFDVAPGRQQSYGAPKRSWFNFMPAVAMSAAMLILLVFVDLSSLNVGGANDSSSAGSSSSAAGRTVEDAAKSSAESANAPKSEPLAPRQAPPIPAPAGGNAQGTQGFGQTPVPQAAAAPPAAGTPSILTAPAAIPPSSSTPAPAIASGAAQAPTPTSYAVIVDADEAGEGPGEDDSGGLTTLRVLEIIAAVVLIGSLGGLYWQRRRGT